MQLPLRIGVVLSAGGSAFERAFKDAGLPSGQFHIVTDRDCGAESKAGSAKISHSRIVESDREQFSKKIAERFVDERCDVVLLHFSRLVSASLFKRIPTFNVHPSLLPAFRGLDGVADAAAAGSLYQGATLHAVDAGMDTGQAIAQTITAVPRQADLHWRRKLGFIQKTILTLLFFDLIQSGQIGPSGHIKFGEGIQGPGQISNPDFSNADLFDRAFSLFNELPQI